jgi:hypothetical protein
MDTDIKPFKNSSEATTINAMPGLNHLVPPSIPLTYLPIPTQKTSLPINGNDTINVELMNPTQLNLIDKLRDLGVGDHVALPQV